MKSCPFTKRLRIHAWAGSFAACLALLAVATGTNAFAQTATTTSLAVSSGATPVTSVASGTVVTLTATVKAGSTSVRPGRVRFCDAEATHCTDIHVLGTAQLTSTGKAVLKFRPGIGAHSYKAVFAGTRSDTSSASSTAALTVTGTPPYPTTATLSRNFYPITPPFVTMVSWSPIGGKSPTGTVSLIDTSDGDKVLGTGTMRTVGTPSSTIAKSQNLFVNTDTSSVLETALGDFNGDGILDLAEVIDNASRYTIQIRLGKGDGTFREATTTLPIGAEPTGLVVGDFNGDNIADLAYPISADGSVNILLGKGDGTFTPAQNKATAANPQGIVVDDFNGDGIEDLAIANYSGNSITILLGNGDGTFEKSAASSATGKAPVAIATGDFNGDGIEDLAVANSEEPAAGVTILLGKGDGTFDAGPSPNDAGPSPNPKFMQISYTSSIVVADFNGDGKADLAFFSNGNVYGNVSSSVLLGNGDGTFTPTTLVWPEVPAMSGALTVGDFNGDGIPDLMVAGGGFKDSAQIVLGNGDGTFNLADLGLDPAVVVSGSAGDLDGDGLPDFVAVGPRDPGNATNVLLTRVFHTAGIAAPLPLPVNTGVNLIASNYPGDSNFSASSSNALTVTALTTGATLGPPNMQFGDRTVGTQSGGSTLVLTSTGTGPLSITGIQLTGANPSSFVLSPPGTLHGCPSSLFGGQQCSVQVQFAPQALGPASAVITVVDNAPVSTQTTSLSGTGVDAASATLSVTSLSYSSQLLGTSSASQQVTVTNKSTDKALIITGITLSGPNASSFAFENNCGSTLAPGAVCDVHGHFSPTTDGANSAVITISDNGLDSPQTIALYGTGVDIAAAALSATSLSFGDHTVGTSSASQQVTLTNPSASNTLFIASVTLSGPNAAAFAFGGNCYGDLNLPHGTSCTLQVHFAPTTTGAQSAVITVTDNAANSPQTVILSGTGVDAPLAVLSATSISYGNQALGTSSASHQVTLTNKSTDKTLTIASIALSGANTSAFTLMNNCGSSLAPGALCDIHGQFTPAAADSYSAVVTIKDDAPDTPQTLSLSGTGVDVPTAVLSATSISYGDQPVYKQSASRQVTLTNKSPDKTLSIYGILLAGPNATAFAFENNCGLTLAPGQLCDIHGHFTPTTTGSYTASVTITDNALDSPQTVTQTVKLSGTGVTAPVIGLSAASLSFGDEKVGEATASKSVTLTNTGSAALYLSSISVTGADASSFDFETDCPTSLAAGASCDIHGHFAPKKTGAVTAEVTIKDDTTNSPQTIKLSGTGQ